MLKTIFLDLDDVLNMFTMYALQLLGVPGVTPGNYSPHPGMWGFASAYNAMMGTDTSSDRVWDMLPNHVWETAPLGPFTRQLVAKSIEIVGRDNVFILTASPNHKRQRKVAAAGKVGWIQRHLPELHSNYIITDHKHLLASPDALLVDDKESNVDAFREAGGRAVLYPRPWNKATHLEPFWRAYETPVVLDTTRYDPDGLH